MKYFIYIFVYSCFIILVGPPSPECKPPKGKVLCLKALLVLSAKNNVWHVVGALKYLLNEFTAIIMNSTKLYNVTSQKKKKSKATICIAKN